MGGGHPQLVPYQVFRSSDGYIVVACLNDRFWQRLCVALGQPELAVDPRYCTNPDRARNRLELVGILETILQTRPSNEWIEELTSHGVPCSPVNELEDALIDPQAVHNRAVVELEHPVTGRYQVVNNPIRMSATPPVLSRPAPDAGQHTAEVLREAGYSDAEVDALVAAGAVSLAG
jgi:crotonobetainyl-CoA:carnitine CoA-transferase CaiB-like acyl-CoA transferase